MKTMNLEILFNYIKNNNIQYTKVNNTLLIYPAVWRIEKLNKLFSIDFFNKEGNEIVCKLRGSYAEIDLNPIIKFYNIDINTWI